MAPTKPIEGVVRDKDTGRPIAGVTLHAAVFDERSHLPAQGIEATTDAQGRYRLTGLPKATGLSPVRRAGRGPALSQSRLPGTGRLARASSP